MEFAAVRGRGILEVGGLRLGHAGRGLSGTTVLLPPAASSVGVDVRGGGPATHETDVIAPGTHSYGADALVLTGGSALGLSAVSGVSAALAEAGLGFPAPGLPGTVIPLIPAAAIYDLGRQDGVARPPDPELGRRATEVALTSTSDFATSDIAVRGSLGVGLGARSGMQSLRSGLGSFAVRTPHGHTVGALVAANPLGTIGTRTGLLWAQSLCAEFGLNLPTLPGLPAAPQVTPAAKNTTIVIIATDAVLDSAQVTRLAASAHAGIARAIRPSHTLYDGDTVFATATGDRELPDDYAAATTELVGLSSAAADAVSLAILDAHIAAQPAEDQPPTLGQLAPDFAEAFAALP